MNILFQIWRALPPGLKNIPFCLYYGAKIPKARPHQAPKRGRMFLAGFFQAPTGLGKSARCYYRELRQAGEDVVAVDLTSAFFQPVVPDLFTEPYTLPEDLAPDDRPGTVIVHANPPAFLYALRLLAPVLPGKHRVGYWAWELLQLPACWKICIPYANRIETPSRFSTAAVHRYTEAVSTHPHATAPPPPHGRRFAEDGVVRVLFMLDLRSNLERKNPLAALAAFKKAFGNSPNAHFCLKTSAMEDCPDAAGRLRRATTSFSNVTIYDARLTAKELDELYDQHDIYLSLHCSEGYGLTIKEAMDRGLHVVATGWSGNMDFMPAAKAVCVPYRMTPSPWGTALRPNLWAEADTDAAACRLHDIVQRERPELAKRFPAPSQREAITPETTALVVVTYNDIENILRCLESIYSMKDKPCRIIVVENGSEGHVAEEVFRGWKRVAEARNEKPPTRSPADCPSTDAAVLVRIEKNSGYASGCNAGLAAFMAEETSKAVWLLNNDVAVEPKALAALCERMNMRPDAGAVASVLVDMEDGARVQVAGGGSFSPYTGVTRDVGRGLRLDVVENGPAELYEARLDYLCGASLLLRRDALKAAGFLDERFYLYYEDLDHSFRLKRHGYGLALANQSVVRHKGGATTSGNAMVDFYSTRNRLCCVCRYNPIALGPALLHVLCGIGKAVLSGKGESARMRIRALFDFLSGKGPAR